MDELESRLNSVLSDPEQLEKITKLAQSFMTGAESPGSAEPTESLPFDMNFVGRIAKLMNSGGNKDKGERAILTAMYPYLSEKRRRKMDKALKIARLARIARLAMEESEENA